MEEKSIKTNKQKTNNNIHVRSKVMEEKKYNQKQTTITKTTIKGGMITSPFPPIPAAISLSA